MESLEFRVSSLAKVCPRRGHIFKQCDVGRGDPTPPCRLPVMSQLPLGRGRGNAPPLPGGEFWLLQYTVMVRRFRQVCRGRIVASRAVYPLYRVTGMAATGGIVAVPTNYP